MTSEMINASFFLFSIAWVAYGNFHATTDRSKQNNLNASRVRRAIRLYAHIFFIAQLYKINSV